MDFASFSQSLTLIFPRGHVGLFSSWGTEPGYTGMETTLPLLELYCSPQPGPARPSTQALSSPWIFKIFRLSEAEETSRFLYKPSTWIPCCSLSLLPVHPMGLCPGPLPHNALFHCSSSPCATGDSRDYYGLQHWWLLSLPFLCREESWGGSQSSFWGHCS